ncbi:MAG TPA: WD40 repeat domain-containing serine/threonine protein kinase, partial [Verrucomicrobiae bacterium]|nr:WD40 repeat domain-containing serine/threonine protein kinase [Verrucomicrobiae bacterium]
METKSERYCPDCGLALLSIEEATGCPHCLFRLAMGDEPETDGAPGQPATPLGLRSRFFGDYEILSELARGGMGVVYRARQISLNRVVALKMIQQGHLPSPEAWLRFQTEIKASAQLNHPNIVALHESGTVEGAHFFTMRLMEGGNLAARLASARKTNGSGTTSNVSRTTREAQRAAVRLMLQVVRAVHYAHQRGILHRDLKPSNILLDEHGEPQVADFGLAKLLAQESAATLTDSILGSPNYMAPEQADGRGKNVTVQTDVYGLGTILYELLTGVPPFQARTPVETIRKVLDEEPIPPRKLNPGIDADLETVCLKCLQKIPGTRYPSAESFAADLERWLEGKPILARPVGPIGSAVRWGRRHPGLATVSALLLVTLVGVAVVASIAAVRIRNAEQVAVMRLRESLLDQVRVVRTSPAAGGRSKSRELLRQAAALGGSAEFREQVRDELLATLGLPDVDFTPLAGVQVQGPLRLLVDPQLKQLARIVDATNLTIASVERPSGTRIFGSTGMGGVLEAFSPDGRYLAVRHARGLEFHDIEAARMICSTEERDRSFCFATHAPLLALEEADCEISLRELPSGQEIRRLKLPQGLFNSRAQGFLALSISPDGKFLACTRAAENTVEVVEMDTGRVRWRVIQEAPVVALAWSLSRGRLATAASDGRMLTYRLFDGAYTSGFNTPSAVENLALDDASGLLAGACRDRRIRIWDLNSLRLVFETEGEGRRLSFDENTTCLGTVIRGDRVGWLTLRQSSEFKEYVVAQTTRHLEECAFTENGDMLAIGYPTRITLLNPNGRGVRGNVTIGEIPVLAMDPRGEFMLTSDGRGVMLRPLPTSASAMLDSDKAELVIPGSRWRALVVSADGNRIWAGNAASNMVYGFNRDFTATPIALGPHEFADAVAASPDDRWVVTGSSLLLNAKVWDVASQTNVATIHAGKNHRLSFSRDGRWLAVHGDVFDLREVGSWKAAPALPFDGPRPTLGAAAFSPDGRILAIVEEQGLVRLFDLKAWKSLGLLQP